jgi:hypothetical protein
MPIRKPWTDHSPDAVLALPPALGVYELGDAAGDVVYVGFAGAKSRHGLREAIDTHFGPAEGNRVIREEAAKFRIEINMMYLSRYVELLQQHNKAGGAVPSGNREPGERLPRLARRPAAGT